MSSLRSAFVGTLVCLSIAASAGAAPLTISNITGDWTNPTGGVPTIVNQAGQLIDTARWGVPAVQDQSGYDFIPTAGAFVPALGVAFSLGTFVHHNNPVGDDGSIPTGIDYSFALDTNGIPSALADIFHFDHNETPNAEPCPSRSAATPCDDIVTSSSLNLDSIITVGGDVFFFNLLGFSQNGGVTISSTFFSPEGQSNTAQLFAVLTQPTPAHVCPVVTERPLATPEPGSIVLIGTGLMGAVARLRRRRKL